MGTSRYDRLLKKLVKAEKRADKKGKGMWERPSIKEKIKSSLPGSTKTGASSETSGFFQNTRDKMKTFFSSKRKN